MESNEALASALVKFQRWCEDGGPMLYSKIDKLETQLASLTEENAKLREESRKLVDRICELNSELTQAELLAETLNDLITQEAGDAPGK